MNPRRTSDLKELRAVAGRSVNPTDGVKLRPIARQICLTNKCFGRKDDGSRFVIGSEVEAWRVRTRLCGGGKKIRTLGPGSERTEAFRENEAVIMARDGLKM
jgi:hypothetical protein